jgi:Cys-tRNA(Pro)/Cys-tRNA(Cys) deacylase
MARSPVEILQDTGIPFVLHEHEPVATVAEILVALPFPAEHHVKTLAFAADGGADGQVVLAALRGCDRLQFGRLARAIGVGRDRIAPLPPERVEAELGLQPGGVCPICDAEVTVVVDNRVLALPRAFCGSGRNDATLELAPADLVRASRGNVAALAAG